MEQKEIATQTSKAVAIPMANPQGMLRSDLIIPYLSLAQANSESVQERRAQQGDMLKSTNFQIFGNPEKPVEVVFLHYPKSEWVIEKRVGDRYKYVRHEPRHAQNETLPWKFWADEEGNEVPEGSKGAIQWRRVKRLSVFSILPDDIASAQKEMDKVKNGELPDPSKALTPVMVSFRSSSYKAGKEVCTFFSQAQSMGVAVWNYKLELGCYLDKNDEGSFYVYQVDRNKCKPVPKEQMQLVEDWARLVNSSAANDLSVHEEGESETYGNSQKEVVSKEAKKDVC